MSKTGWNTPDYTKEKINSAGRTLLNPTSVSVKEYDEALTVVNNWRSCHGFPLNTIQVRLRQKAKEIYAHSLVAQRIKRLPSILAKLQREPKMKLTQMQDLGGCRAVVDSVKKSYDLVASYQKGDIRHELVHVDDYIVKPRSSGYRGIHLIYKYFSDRNQTYNGLKIEMQIRSAQQHAWATAVEVIGTLIQQALKSSQGEQEWLRFFALMGSAIANLEKTPMVPGTPTDIKILKTEISKYAKRLEVEHRLRTYGEALKILEENEEGAHYFLLTLNPSIHEVKVKGFKQRELQQASTEYLQVEQDISKIPGAETVLVSVDSVSSLQRAYPNYFLDTDVFIQLVKKTIGK